MAPINKSKETSQVMSTSTSCIVRTISRYSYLDCAKLPCSHLKSKFDITVFEIKKGKATVHSGMDV
jgi:hypothetical protein